MTSKGFTKDGRRTKIKGFVDFTAGDQGFYDRQLVINNPSTEN